MLAERLASTRDLPTMGANLASTGVRDCGMHAEHH